jgi:hypothetical protein
LLSTKLQVVPEFYMGLSHGLIAYYGRREKICTFLHLTYAILPGCNWCTFPWKKGISLEERNFEIYPNDAIFDEWKEDTGNVAGCGLLLDPDNKVSIFFTENGTLMGELSFL